MTNGWMIGIVLLLIVPVVIITTIIPLLTRRIESFGVTIPEDAQKDPEVVALRKQYIAVNSVLGVVITLSLILFSINLADEKQWSMLLIGHLFGYIIISYAIYLKQHFAVKALKAQKQWLTNSVQRVMVDTKFRRGNLTLSYAWFIPHIVLILATVLVGVLAYERFPDPIPMQYGMDGEVTRSVAKSYTAVLWPALTQAILLVIFIFSNFMIAHSKQLVEASDPVGSLKRNVIFRRRWSGFLIIISFLTIALLTFIQLSTMFGWGSGIMLIVPLIITGVIVIGSIIMSITTGQGGSRIKLADGSQGSSLPAADHDQHWKLGMFYFNPADPALFVEKRFGVGWTMNFGRPLGWIIILAILALPLLLIFIE